MPETTPNLFAYLALLSWPLIAFFLFQALPVARALLWTILGAYLLLPVGATIKFDMVPQFDKISIPNLAALGCTLIAGRSFRWGNEFGLAEFLILTLLIGPFVTSEFNGDPLAVGGRVLPGIGHYEALSALLANLFSWFPSFWDGNFCVERLTMPNCSVCSLWRDCCIHFRWFSRFGPVRSRIPGFMGIFPTRLGSRYGTVGIGQQFFWDTDLLVAFFIMTAGVAATAYWRAQRRVLRLPALLIAANLSFVLLLCKTLGALLYGGLGTPVRSTRPQIQFRVALVLVVIALLYPALRATDMFPTKALVEIAQSFDEDRAGSLQFRFTNEDQLLDHVPGNAFSSAGVGLDAIAYTTKPVDTISA